MQRAVTWRAVLLAVLLSVINILWTSHAHVWRQSNAATVSLFYNVVFTLLVLNALNLLLRRWAPRAALTGGELVVIYAVLSIATAICGLDLMQMLIPCPPEKLHPRVSLGLRTRSGPPGRK